ncbi:MAG: sigma-54 dependent transcriptional regulator [Proteobacteria bacterium]|nr:sigma-54 dependent transcriptional regulator [Pseudomonadota bacterium]
MPETDCRILLVDDDPRALKNLRRILKKEGYQVFTDSNPVHALERLEAEFFDLLVSDLKMPHLNGMELLDRVKTIAPEVEVIIISGYASLEGAVEATKKGAYHFLAKPFTPDDIRSKAAEALSQKRVRDQARSIESRPGPGAKGSLIIGQSPRIRRIAEIISQIAPTDCGVLICGESGTGKELVAQAIHAQSKRVRRPWVAFNCAAFSPELMENELFGHEKGAYTGAHQTRAGLLEMAQGGTVFFDEIGEMPPAMQVKLLRALQEREVLRVGGARPVPVDLRVVAATARDLQEEVAAGAFRQDLFYRINVVRIDLPTLAERGEDIPLLAYHFLWVFKRRMNKQVKGIDPEALGLLSAYAFPGNVRELMNIMERAVALCQGEVIQPRDLPQDLALVKLARFDQSGDHSLTLEQLERNYILHVLNRTGWVRNRAATILGIDRVSLWRKMKKYGIE